MSRVITSFALWVLLLIPVHSFADSADGAIWLLDLNGPIGPASADYLLRGIEGADSAGASAVILRIDTPGGLDGAMRDIIHGILESPIPIVGYVSPQGSRAASAGTYIVYATHIAAMAPATTLGAATPVQIGGSAGIPGTEPPVSREDQAQPEQDPVYDGAEAPEDGEDTVKEAASNSDAMRNKVVNDARGYIRGLAELRGRNARWAESAVTDAATLTASEALEKHVIDLIAEDVEDLLLQLHGREVLVGKVSHTLNTTNVQVTNLEPDWRTRFLSIVTNPSTAYVLLMIGIYGLILEFSNPGIGAGGVVGAIALLLALYALQLLPISYSALGLMLLGLGLMAAEAFSPSFGILGVGGVIAFVVGSIMLIDTDVPGFQIALPLILSVAAVSAGFLIVVLAMLLKSRHQALASGTSTMIGEEAVVVQNVNGELLVKVHGELWRARSDEDLHQGERVKICAISGLTLNVIKEK